jgi:phosphate transport system substrate-binding protein
MTNPDPAPLPDTLPERYQVRHLLASGGSGDAYLAWDTSLQREIVIKRIRTGSVDEDMAKWISAEAGKMAALKHPNIVAVYDLALSEGMPCIVMEHVRGTSLDERVTTSGPLRIELFIELAHQTLDALFAAHQAGMIHRDLKPLNVMISDLPSGSIQAKLLDFGLAKFIDIQAPSPQTVMQDGSIHGTTHYISPEQLRREPVGIYSDIYSLGCTLYFALMGQPPFGGQNVSEVITSHLSHLVPSPSDLRPEIPKALSDWLMKLIERHPSDRFSSALAALQALRTVENDSQTLVPTTRSIPIRLGKSLDAVPVVQERKATLPIPLTVKPTGPLAVKPTGPQAVQPLIPKPVQPQPQRRRRLLPLGLGIAAILALGTLIGSLSFGDQAVNLWAKYVALFSTSDGPVPASEIPVIPPPLPPPLLPVEPEVVVAVEKEQPVEVAAPVIAPPVVVTPPPEPEITFRIAGSNTLGLDLVPSLVEGFLLKMRAVNLVRTSPTKDETLITYERAGTQVREAVLIQAHGSATAFGALRDGTCQVGMSSRPIKPAEITALQSLGDMQSPACEHVVGLDGLAVIVHPSNPVSVLTIPQLAGIFSGQIRDWSAVGGLPGPIHLYARDDRSGTYDRFKETVLGDLLLEPQAKRYEDSAALADEVTKDAASVGFIGLPWVKDAKAVAVSDTGARPLLPTPFSVATEDYALARRLFLYCAAASKHPWTADFCRFVLSDEGQTRVEKAGFVSQRVEIEKVAPTSSMPERYGRFVKTAAGRLSVNFRFRSGKVELDTKAVRDLERVVKFLALPENRRRPVHLLGFSDSTGTPANNLKISAERIQEVLKQLTMRGVQIGETISMGSEMPIISNNTLVGQEKNRRVEIWLGAF